MTQIDTNITAELRKLITNTPWQWYRLEGVNKYGISQCQRIINYKHIERNILRNKYNIKWGGGYIKPYQVEYIWNNDALPIDLNLDYTKDTKPEISHICGVPDIRGYSVCCEISHMKLETSKENKKRKKCHSIIRNFEKHFMRRQGHSNCTLYRKRSPYQGGPIFVRDVSPDEKYQIGLILKRGKAKALSKYKYYQCECKPRCFIQYNA